MRPAFRLAVLVVAIAATVGATVPLLAQRPTAEAALDQLLARATWYSIDFINGLSNIVAEEQYIQNSNVALATAAIPILGGRAAFPASAPRTSRHRELKADFLIVKSEGAYWTPFRDVFEVDHIPIRDREERLAKLFLNKKPGDTGESAAKAIAEESARYNLGSVQRTINNPAFAMIILQPEVRDRFKFTAGKPDKKMGDDISVIDYVELGRPTVIAGPPGEDMPAFGRFWIETATGRVVKAEVRVEVKNVKANLTTTFRTDERLGMDVPAELREDYDLPDSRVTGVASYTRFRKFDVKSSEDITPPQK